jgi:hypothetical protein
VRPAVGWHAGCDTGIERARSPAAVDAAMGLVVLAVVVDLVGAGGAAQPGAGTLARLLVPTLNGAAVLGPGEFAVAVAMVMPTAGGPLAGRSCR